MCNVSNPNGLIADPYPAISFNAGPDLVPDPAFAITLEVELHTSSFLYSSFNRFYLFYFLKTTF
jgi:hypothetical protein